MAIKNESAWILTQNNYFEIIIISGDPNSINSEIIFKSWKKIKKKYKQKIYFVSNVNLLKEQFKKLKYRIKLKEVKDIDDDKTTALKIINIDLDNNNFIKEMYKISTIPLFVLYRNDKEIWRKNGIIAFSDVADKL